MATSADITDVREFLNSSHRHLMVAGGLLALTIYSGMPSVPMVVVGLLLGSLLAGCLTMAWRRRTPVCLPLLYALLPLGWYLCEDWFSLDSHTFESSQGLLLMYLAYFVTLYLFRARIIRYARLEAPIQL